MALLPSIVPALVSVPTVFDAPRRRPRLPPSITPSALLSIVPMSTELEKALVAPVIEPAFSRVVIPFVDEAMMPSPPLEIDPAAVTVNVPPSPYTGPDVDVETITSARAAFGDPAARTTAESRTRTAGRRQKQ